MLKKIFVLIRKIIVSCVILYSFNLLVSALSINIPINYYSVAILTLFEFPGLLSLVIIFLVAL